MEVDHKLVDDGYSFTYLMLMHEFHVLELRIEMDVYDDNNHCPSFGKGMVKSFKLMCICRRYLLHRNIHSAENNIIPILCLKIGILFSESGTEVMRYLAFLATVPK